MGSGRWIRRVGTPARVCQIEVEADRSCQGGIPLWRVALTGGGYRFARHDQLSLLREFGIDNIVSRVHPPQARGILYQVTHLRPVRADPLLSWSHERSRLVRPLQA